MKIRYIQKNFQQIPHDEFRKIVRNQNFKCNHCGILEGSILYKHKRKIVIKLTQDHIIPLSLGGKTIKENIQALCYRCNKRKSNKHPDHYKPINYFTAKH